MILSLILQKYTFYFSWSCKYRCVLSNSQVFQHTNADKCTVHSHKSLISHLFVKQPWWSAQRRLTAQSADAKQTSAGILKSQDRGLVCCLGAWKYTTLLYAWHFSH